MNLVSSLRRAPRLAVVVAFVALAAAGAVAYAGGSGPSTTAFTPQKADQVTNIDVLRSQLKNYYGDPTATTGPASQSNPDPGWAHPLNQSSNYADEVRVVADEGGQWLAARAKTPNAAIVLDVDDTTLATWNYELYSNWDYNPVTNGNFVLGQLFPAVPGMVEMVTKAAQEGYAIFWITGRPTAQEPATLGNLTADGIGVDAGYPAPTTLSNGEDGLFTKPSISAYPPYLQTACAAEIALGKSCTTIHYKSATRAHIEALGYDIVGDFGDQYSDLIGGYADKTFKLPNPNYYLP
ncbi:MAG: HAD family acid phosphatase [Gaiellaceae bacterium]